MKKGLFVRFLEIMSTIYMAFALIILIFSILFIPIKNLPMTGIMLILAFSVSSNSFLMRILSIQWSEK